MGLGILKDQMRFYITSTLANYFFSLVAERNVVLAEIGGVHVVDFQDGRTFSKCFSKCQNYFKVLNRRLRHKSSEYRLYSSQRITAVIPWKTQLATFIHQLISTYLFYRLLESIICTGTPHHCFFQCPVCRYLWVHPLDMHDCFREVNHHGFSEPNSA